MSWIKFESGREKDLARNAVRESREKILEKAESEYRKKQMRAEEAKLRGDDKWMLPSVESKIEGDKKFGKKRKKEKKEKKEKKAKKKKKKKKQKKETNSSSSSGSSEDDDEEEENTGEEWVEKTDWIKKTPPPTKDSDVEKPIVRDEWMSLPGLFPCVNRKEEKRSKEDEKLREKRDKGSIEQLGKSDKELNPYWKNGGSGLPEIEEERKDNVGRRNSMDVKWLLKGLQRAKEQASEEGRSLEEVAAERWGSLAKLESMIAEAERENSGKSYGKDFYRRRGEYSGDRKDGGRDSERRRRDSRSRSRERFKSRENYAWGKGSSAFRERRLGFKKPDEESNLNAAGTSRRSVYSSSSSKNWKKPEARERDVKREVPRSDKKSESESDGDSDQKSNEKEILDTIMTEAEMNKLGARIVKCEIMGDDELAIELKAKLEKAREARRNAPTKKVDDDKEESVILTKTDSRGMTRPVEPRTEYEEPKGGRGKKKKKIDTHEGGQRVRYFADDDKYSIKDMFQEERGRSTNDDDAMFSKIASKSMDMDEMFEDQVRFKERDAKSDERDRLRAIKQHEKMSKSLDSCQWCIDSKRMLKHMIVAMGSKVYMSLPSHGSLTIGHCILAPIHHVICQTQLDEDVWDELQNFRKAVTKMFLDQDEDVVFFETSMMHRKFPHMQLECVPMPKEIGDMAPIYFKKALLECETEWSTNKKVVDLSKKDVRKSIPKGLPYFAVDFGMQGGFAHVIEDENLFPKNFAQEIIGGMLDLDRNAWRKPKRENFDQQRSKVIEFAKMWKKYDFTNGDSDSD